jgi:hypothetical protein
LSDGLCQDWEHGTRDLENYGAGRRQQNEHRL